MNMDFIMRTSLVWAVAERGSMGNGNIDGQTLDCSGMSAVCCTLWGVELSGCCAEMVACGEGKKCNNPLGDNQELSFEACDHWFGYGRTEKWPSIQTPIWGERGVGAGCSPASRVNEHVRLLANLDCRGTCYVWCLKKALNIGRGIPITCRNWQFGWDEDECTNGLLEVQISRPVIFSCGAVRKRKCTCKTSRKGTIGVSYSERNHKRPKRLPAEGCGFHSLSFEEAGGCRLCLYWILNYTFILPFKNVHVYVTFAFVALEILTLWPFLNAYLLPSHPVKCQEMPAIIRCRIFYLLVCNPKI